MENIPIIHSFILWCLRGVDKIMEIFYTRRQGLRLSTVEKYYIYGGTVNGNELSDQDTMEQNAVFNTLFHLDP